MRINDSENTFIFKPKDNAEPIQQEMTTSYYTIFGEHDFIDSLNRPRTKTDSTNLVVNSLLRLVLMVKFLILLECIVRAKIINFLVRLAEKNGNSKKLMKKYLIYI